LRWTAKDIPVSPILAITILNPVLPILPKITTSRGNGAADNLFARNLEKS
jgi:hypothetical protein